MNSHFISEPMTSSSNPYLGTKKITDTSNAQAIQVKQRIGDFGFAGNVLYILLAMGSVVVAANVALRYSVPDAVIILLSALLGTAAIALRIKIFNRFAFKVYQIRISKYGDLQWTDGWLPQNEIACIESRAEPHDSMASEVRYAVTCITKSGDTHHICSNLTKLKADFISRDLSHALGTIEHCSALRGSTSSLRSTPAYIS